MSSWGESNLLIASRLDRPASTQTAIKQKEAERQEILNAVELFLAQGGSIKTIPSNLSKEAQLMKMRAGEIPLISMREISDRWQQPMRAMAVIMSKWPTLMYIMDGTERLYSLEDIKRCEQQPNYRMHKTIL